MKSLDGYLYSCFYDGKTKAGYSSGEAEKAVARAEKETPNINREYGIWSYQDGEYVSLWSGTDHKEVRKALVNLWWSRHTPVWITVKENKDKD